jgi:RNA polymerase sigma-70 factor, ECF subfamily
MHHAQLGEAPHDRQTSGLHGRAHGVRGGGVDDDEEDSRGHGPQFTLRELFHRPRHNPSEATIETVKRPAVSAPERSDEELMLDLRRGGTGGAAIFERYRNPVWQFFRRRVSDPARAEELAQDVFTAILEAAPRYEPRASFRSYLFGIAYNVLMADRRKRPTTAGWLDEVEPSANASDPVVALWVRRALAQLDDIDREVLMLREYERLSYQEIANLQQIPINTVRSRLFRARIAMRDALMPNAGHGPMSDAVTPRVAHGFSRAGASKDGAR